jgi:hypothetical protein
LADALLVALLVAFLGFAAAETHGWLVVIWDMGWVSWCELILGWIGQLRESVSIDCCLDVGRTGVM